MHAHCSGAQRRPANPTGQQQDARRPAPPPPGVALAPRRRRPQSASRAPSVAARAFSFKLPTLPANPFEGLGEKKKKSPSPRSSGGQDPDTVFVAGSTGRLGLRIVRQLLLSNPALKIRAGARNTEAAADGVAAAVRAGLLSPADAARIAVVPADLEAGPDAIRAAIGPAGVVVQAIGASETSADLSAPRRIDGDASIALVAAAKEAGVSYFVMVTSLGTGKLGWPASALNLFGGILTQKRRAEVALEGSGIPYLILRPGGLERPGDDHGATHAVVALPRDTTFGGTLSRLQVADVVAAAVGDRTAAENKTVELVSEAGAPRVPLRDLLAAHPADEPQAARLARLDRDAGVAAAKAEAAASLAAANEALAAARAEAEEAAAAAKAARAALAAARAEAGPALAAAERAAGEAEATAAAAEEARLREGAAKAVLAAAQAASRKGLALTPADERAIRLPFVDPEAARAAAAARLAEERAMIEQAVSQKQAAAKAAAERKAAEAAAASAAASAAAQARVDAEAAAKAKAKAEEAAAAAAAARKKDAAASAAASAASSAAAASTAAAEAAQAKEEKDAAAAAAAADAKQRGEAAAAAAARAAAAAAVEAARAALKERDDAAAAAAAAAAAPAPAGDGDDQQQQGVEETPAATAAVAVPAGEEPSPAVASARAWIRAWRAKALEAPLKLNE